jgi:REP element-mobilizing transposase RayT
MPGELRHRGRRSIRLPGFDYAAGGVFFVTLCVHDRRLFFGEVREGTMHLGAAGGLVESAWRALPSIHKDVAIDVFQVMPNHLHGILAMRGATAAPEARRESLADVVRRFKTYTTRRYIEGVHDGSLSPFDGRLWQRNYYERVVRDDDELERTRTYIAANPARWDFDRENPSAIESVDL